jgi:NADPH-dependent glutamate synthase beta subunit-like oxidoreductase
MAETSSAPYRCHVAIIGGATAGAEAADKLAAEGALCVVFEQNERPYGKVEDGLPLWHTALRKKEYDLIDAKLARSGVHFVPRTAVGRDLSFRELLESWGFDVIVLAHGAWRDRPLPVDGAEAYVGRGLVYQNPLIYWFNHQHEPGYAGPRYEIPDGAIVVGGGLASIDVVKVVQLVTARDALARRGIEVGLLELEGEGIPETLARHGIEWKELGLRGCTLFYRRRIEDMPLTEIAATAKPEQVEKAGAVRRRILEKAQSKFLFNVEPLSAPVGLVVEGDRLVGLRFARTRIDASGRAEVVRGDEREVRADLTISSIGSIPEPIEGLAMHGELLRIEDLERGKIADYEHVFGCGNVITGKGNLVASRRHSGQVAAHLTQRIAARANGGRSPETTVALLDKVRARQREVGFDGDYRSWIERVRPEGFA